MIPFDDIPEKAKLQKLTADQGLAGMGEWGDGLATEAQPEGFWGVIELFCKWGMHNSIHLPKPYTTK